MYFKNKEKTKIKKMTTLVLTLLVLFNLCACNGKTQDETSATDNVMEEFKEKSPMLDEGYDYVRDHMPSQNENDANEDIDMEKILEQAQKDIESGETTFAFTLDEFLSEYNGHAKSTNTEEFTDIPRITESNEVQPIAYAATCYLKADKEMNFPSTKIQIKFF